MMKFIGLISFCLAVEWFESLIWNLWHNYEKGIEDENLQ